MTAKYHLGGKTSNRLEQPLCPARLTAPRGASAVPGAVHHGCPEHAGLEGPPPATRTETRTDRVALGPAAHSPGADPHQRDGGAREEHGEQQEGLPAPNVRESTNERGAEERQQTLKKVNEEKCTLRPRMGRRSTIVPREDLKQGHSYGENTTERCERSPAPTASQPQKLRERFDGMSCSLSVFRFTAY